MILSFLSISEEMGLLSDFSSESSAWVLIIFIDGGLCKDLGCVWMHVMLSWELGFPCFSSLISHRCRRRRKKQRRERDTVIVWVVED